MPGRVVPGRVVLGGVAVIGVPVKEVALEEEETRLEDDDRLELVGALDDVTPAQLDFFVEVELFEVLVDRAEDLEVAAAGAWVDKCSVKYWVQLLPLRSGNLEPLESSGHWWSGNLEPLESSGEWSGNLEPLDSSGDWSGNLEDRKSVV